MILTNGNGNGYHPAALTARALLALVRSPTLALLRRYADWVEQTSRTEVAGPGASYAGSAIYVCRFEDVPMVFLHRAHYDDRTLLDPHPFHDALALYAHAAGLVVSRGYETPPEIERAVRAGNGAIYVIGDDERNLRAAELAAALALRTRAPVIPLRARADRTVQVRWLGGLMHWPHPRNRIELEYGALEYLQGTQPEASARVRALLSRP